MPTTQLFVELLVIGIGVAAWLLLFAAAAFGWHLSPDSLSLGPAEALALTALAYVLGIIMDRIARALLGRFLPRPDYVCSTPTPDAELIICRKSERLWNTCAYNRSRLRICRAWTLNFALLALAYAVWNARVGIPAWHSAVFISLCALVLCLLSAWATVQLNRDYYLQIESVYRLLTKATHPPTTKAEGALDTM